MELEHHQTERPDDVVVVSIVRDTRCLQSLRGGLDARLVRVGRARGRFDCDVLHPRTHCARSAHHSCRSRAGHDRETGRAAAVGSRHYEIAFTAARLEQQSVLGSVSKRSNIGRTFPHALARSKMRARTSRISSPGTPPNIGTAASRYTPRTTCTIVWLTRAMPHEPSSSPPRIARIPNALCDLRRHHAVSQRRRRSIRHMLPQHRLPFFKLFHSVSQNH